MANFLDTFAGEEKYRTHWQWYKKFFNENIFKFFISFVSLLPIIAKVFQSQNNDGTIAPVIESKLKGLFSWELIWLSAVLYLIAYLLYSLFCPTFIKTYNNFKEYQDYNHSPRWLVWLSKGIIKDKRQIDKFIERLTKKKYINKTTVSQSNQAIAKPNITVEEKQTLLSFTHKNENYEFGLPLLDSSNAIDETATDTAVNEVFWEIFGRYASNKKYLRILIWLLLAGCIALFSWAVFQYMFSMMKYIF